jgi:hypothetical protein
VRINGIPDKARKTIPAGKNPFEELAVAIADDGKSVKVLQYAHNTWLPYDDKPGWPLANRPPVHRWGQRIQLSSLYRIYDWVTDNGPENFEKWIGRPGKVS